MQSKQTVRLTTKPKYPLKVLNLACALDGFSYANIADLANAARGADPEGYRAEFVRLVRMAETLGAVAQR